MIKNKGITLIALIITVIIILILAGISISFLTSDNGILKKAKEASEKYKLAENDETENLNKTNQNFNKYLLDQENLPENSSETTSGTIVKLPDSWSEQTMRYLSIDTGIEITSSTKIATVYAVATGNGAQVPVPYGFYYVGGNIENGVVISDSEPDKNKYIGQINVGKDLQGNQFVWIPCTELDYIKYNWGTSYTNTNGWDVSTQSSEKGQVKKYGGFYVGRYEAGTSNARFNTDITAPISASNFQSNVFALSNVSSDSKPTTKSNEIPWMHADYDTALTISERMYNTDYVYSGMITGTQWDVMLNWMSNEQNKSLANASNNSFYQDLKANCIWGNYINITLNDCDGKYATVNTSNGSTSAWSNNTSRTNKVSSATVLTTGASETAKKKNLYDVAGNLWEWTQESAYYSNGTNLFIDRSGGCEYSYSVIPASYRDYSPIGERWTTLGFRPVLYMK